MRPSKRAARGSNLSRAVGVGLTEALANKQQRCYCETGAGTPATGGSQCRLPIAAPSAGQHGVPQTRARPPPLLQRQTARAPAVRQSLVLRTLIRFGMGTQRVEEERAASSPGPRARRQRLDENEALRAVGERLRGAEHRVLLGTQMIAKGLVFPFVSFVGVVNADTSMSMPTSGGERTFQMITQVRDGRPGRPRAGDRAEPGGQSRPAFAAVLTTPRSPGTS